MVIKMNRKICLVLLVISVMPYVWSKGKKFQKNSLSKTRCDLTCIDVTQESRSLCRSDCRAQEKKPGTCPELDTPHWSAACVTACSNDVQCDGVQRCCVHGCSASCQDPVDLMTLPGLPALPAIEDVKEKRRSVVIRWTNGVGDAARAVPGKVLYMLEEQHHMGPVFDAAQLGDWSLVLRTNKTKVSLKNQLKSGHWYRFRVAAVSSSGTRGFSEPSAPFTPRRGPKSPPPPKRLRVRRLATKNDTISVRLEWTEPRSDLPVSRYKVFWSRRVLGVDGELDSVLVHRQSIPKGKTSIDINDLQPDSLYFFQVQTISHYGSGKLRSEKAAVFYNTTSSAPVDDIAEPIKKRALGKVKGLKFQNIVWFSNKIRARLSWQPVSNAKHYYVQWKIQQCENPINSKLKHKATTRLTSFDIYELQYNCTYKVNVNSSSKSKTAESEITIHVPGCEYFKKRINGTQINCELNKIN